MSTTRRPDGTYRTGTDERVSPSRRYHVRGGPRGELIALPAHVDRDHYAQRWQLLYTVTMPRRGPVPVATLTDTARTHFTQGD